MRRGAWVAGSAALLVLAGCSDPQPANDTLPTAVSTSAAPTLEPLGPADFPVPDEAREQTEAGAEAMADYYLGLVNFVGQQANADTAPLLDLSSGCATCAQIAAGVDALRAAGQRVEGAQLRVNSFGSTDLRSGEASIAWLVSEAPSQTFDSNGQEIASEARPGQQLGGGIDFSWDDERTAWIATQVTLDSL